MRARSAALAGLALLVLGSGPAAAESPVVVGSKKFTEGVILGELLTRLARSAGAEARHRRELGGTRILWRALRTGEIDAYVEYTGTLHEEIFAQRDLDDRAALEAALAEAGLAMSAPLGFNNTYALGMRREEAARLGIESISDMPEHPDLSLGLSDEFLDRADGWPGLRQRYGLPQSPTGLDHDLGYRALASGQIDVTDVYTTDAEIAYHDLRVLVDDRGYFPAYEAVIVYRRDLAAHAPAALEAMRRLTGRLDEAQMAALNERVKIDGESEAAVAADFLRRELNTESAVETVSLTERLAARTREHLVLVAVSLAGAIVLGLPVGVAAALRRRPGEAILGAVGVLQTIPSLAMFVFMIPLLGIGAPPTIAALFLYSLLPIVRNTHAGLVNIPSELQESARALGLPRAARLRLIELPLALPSVLAGIKTSAVINAGTATLGALVGAGGYGQPILTGIRLDDHGLILSGAVPSALLALFIQGLFELIERGLVRR